jgi:plasmid stabilization system protein ParE
MSRELRFHDDALAEIISAADWYDRQRQGLGDHFLDALHARLMQLVDVPTLGSRLAGSPADIRVRRLLLARFPYVVVFVEVGDEIRVIAVMHAKRRPGYWMRRLEK